MHPDLRLVGYRHGYFSEEESPQVAAAMAISCPQLGQATTASSPDASISACDLAACRRQRVGLAWLWLFSDVAGMGSAGA
jgi:hypothetical protein